MRAVLPDEAFVVASRSNARPSFSATRCDGTLPGSMIATRRSNPRTSRAWSRQAAAASVA
jgi:hypothetical protein